MSARTAVDDITTDEFNQTNASNGHSQLKSINTEHKHTQTQPFFSETPKVIWLFNETSEARISRLSDYIQYIFEPDLYRNANADGGFWTRE